MSKTRVNWCCLLRLSNRCEMNSVNASGCFLPQTRHKIKRPNVCWQACITNRSFFAVVAETICYGVAYDLSFCSALTSACLISFQTPSSVASRMRWRIFAHIRMLVQLSGIQWLTWSSLYEYSTTLLPAGYINTTSCEIDYFAPLLAKTAFTHSDSGHVVNKYCPTVLPAASVTNRGAYSARITAIVTSLIILHDLIDKYCD